MARGKNLLTDTQIKRLPIAGKKHRYADGDGLYLSVEVSGSKRWEYTFNQPNGKRTSKTLGKYPEVGLKEAREKRDAFKYGTPPTKMTFNELKEDYFNYHKNDLSEKYIKDGESKLENHFSHIKNVPLTDLTKKHFIDGFTRMQKKNLGNTVTKTGSMLNRIFDYGVSTGKIENNPMYGVKANFFTKKMATQQYAHITDENMLRALLCAINTYNGITFNVRAAMKFAVYAFVRPGMIQHMVRSEIDFEKKIWTIPASKMKTSRDHIVPLTDTMISILQAVLDTHTSEYVFPSPTSNHKVMSENTLTNSLKRLEVCAITAHGLRHTASTFLNENMDKHGQRAEIIEVQLAHTDKNIIRGVYNKAVYIEERRMLMQWWSDYLDSLQENCE